MVDITQGDIEEAVRQLIIGATGMTDGQVIRGNQSAPAPNGEYATVLSISTDQLGPDWTDYFPSQTEGLMDTSTIGYREVSLSVQFYRSNTFLNARSLLQYAKTPNGRFLLQQNKLSWRRESPITMIDEVDRGNKWEKRAAITLNLGYTETTAQEINALESAEITVNYSGETDISEVLNVTSS